MPRNPSELARLSEEYADIILKLNMPMVPKGQKEDWVRELRQLEKQLGIKGSSYNSDEFKFYS